MLRRTACIYTIFLLVPSFQSLLFPGLTAAKKPPGFFLRLHKSLSVKSLVRRRHWQDQHCCHMTRRPGSGGSSSERDWEIEPLDIDRDIDVVQTRVRGGSRSQALNGKLILAGVLTAVTILTIATLAHLIDFSAIWAAVSDFSASEFMKGLVASIKAEGPRGYLKFAAFYITAEVLTIPTLPLAASAGYLFGIFGGTGIVLFCASFAAGVSFLLGRTYLRRILERKLGTNPKFRAIDSAIAKQGFKIVLLIRLSPIFPFALANYLYGLTSVKFGSYLAASVLGFLPGTFAFVYGGGQMGALVDGSSSVPWYGYVIGVGFAIAAIKIISSIAMKAIAEVEPGLIEGEAND